MPKTSQKPRRRKKSANPDSKKASQKAAPHSWQLQTAKARFSEGFRLARAAGPPLIMRRGKEGVLMLPVEQFDQLVVRSHQPESLVHVSRESPRVRVKLDLERDTAMR